MRSSSTRVASGLSSRTVVLSRSGRVTSLIRAFAELVNARFVKTKVMKNINNYFCNFMVVLLMIVIYFGVRLHIELACRPVWIHSEVEVRRYI